MKFLDQNGFRVDPAKGGDELDRLINAVTQPTLPPNVDTDDYLN